MSASTTSSASTKAEQYRDLLRVIADTPLYQHINVDELQRRANGAMNEQLRQIDRMLELIYMLRALQSRDKPPQEPLMPEKLIPLTDLLQGLQSAGRERVKHWLLPKKPKQADSSLASQYEEMYRLAMGYTNDNRPIQYSNGMTGTPVTVYPEQSPLNYFVSNLDVRVTP